jgi:hypothetical protein
MVKKIPPGFRGAGFEIGRMARALENRTECIPVVVARQLQSDELPVLPLSELLQDDELPLSTDDCLQLDSVSW